jgi:hypothetical protein
MDNNLEWLISILPYAFALHNTEDVSSMERWTKSNPTALHPKVTTCPQHDPGRVIIIIIPYL